MTKQNEVGVKRIEPRKKSSKVQEIVSPLVLLSLLRFLFKWDLCRCVLNPLTSIHLGDPLRVRALAFASSCFPECCALLKGTVCACSLNGHGGRTRRLKVLDPQLLLLPLAAARADGFSMLARAVRNCLRSAALTATSCLRARWNRKSAMCGRLYSEGQEPRSRDVLRLRSLTGRLPSCSSGIREISLGARNMRASRPRTP